MQLPHILLACFTATLLMSSPAAVRGAEKIEAALDVAPVWSAHPVGFALLTHGQRQFVAFYDDQRRMTVATRTLDANQWQFHRLPITTGWDSHNYIALAADDDGYLHLSGDMHVVPLIYFRTKQPLDIASFERVPGMVGRDEQKCTYPRFLRGPKNELLFTYRDGSSGDGNQIFNVYEHATKTWKRLLDQPLTDGQGERNAYFNGPQRGPDGYFHLCWVWRETSDAATNHDLSYARSKDLLSWETAAGKPLKLPITLAASDIVDPVPVKGGIINGNTMIGFDTKQRPIIGYHKYDEKGNTQIYNSRFEDGRWKAYQASDWDYRWDFGGGGSLVFEVGLGPVRVEPDGRLSQHYRHAKYGSGTWVIDEATLKPTGQLPQPPAFPPALQRVESDLPGMQVKWSGDGGASGESGVRYALRWETLPQNRDQPRAEPLPKPVMLRLYKLKTENEAPIPASASTATPPSAPPSTAKSTATEKAPPFAKEIQAFETADLKQPPPTGAVLFIGSSSIRLWSTLARDIPEIPTINRGFGGSQIADSVRYADRIVIPYKPKLIVMYAGGNDLNAGKSPGQVLKDFQAFVATVHAALPDTHIAYISINPSVARWKHEARVLEANRLIEAFTRDNARLSYLDSHAKMLSAEGQPRPEILRADGLHLNAKGYELWTTILKPQILALAAKQAVK